MRKVTRSHKYRCQKLLVDLQLVKGQFRLPFSRQLEACFVPSFAVLVPALSFIEQADNASPIVATHEHFGLKMLSDSAAELVFRSTLVFGVRCPLLPVLALRFPILFLVSSFPFHSLLDRFHYLFLPISLIFLSLFRLFAFDPAWLMSRQLSLVKGLRVISGTPLSIVHGGLVSTLPFPSLLGSKS